MPGEDKSLYSQGLNFSSYISDGVDPRTGQFTCSVALYKAPAEARNCPPLNLTLSYDPLSLRNVGLGLGWSLNLSSYRHRLQSPTLYLSTGEHFQVDRRGELTVKDKKLESFKFHERGGDGYEIVYKSGLVETLSNAHNSYDAAVPVQLRSYTGQSLTLGWIKHGSEAPQLTTISQGSEVLLQLEYRSTQVVVTRSPNTTDTCVTTLTLQGGLLTQILPPQAEAQSHPWQFIYKDYQVNTTRLTRLTRVVSPAKLVSEVVYEPQGHLLPQGAPIEAIPRVSSHTMKPGNGQPDLETRYTYSPENFFGHGNVQTWQDGVDNLYRATSKYQYKTTSTVTGGPKVTSTYNKFHLLVETKREQGPAAVKHVVQYDVDTASHFEQQKKSFQLPIKTTTTYEDNGDSGPRSRSETTEHEYDDWGNPLSETDKSGVCTKRVYYPPEGEGKAGEEYFCPADPGGFCRYIKTETVHPSTESGLLPAPTQMRQYKYIQLPTVSGQEHFVAVQEMHLRDAGKNTLLLSTAYDYHIDTSLGRNYGRLKSEATALVGQKPVMSEWTYSYGSTNDKVAKTSKAASWDGKLSMTQDTTYALRSGQALGQTSAQGVRDVFEYDKMDRLKAVTAAEGTPYKAMRKAEYELLKTGSGSIMVITDSKGLQTRQTMDALCRVCRVERQGDVNAKLRIVEEKSYNNLGQCIEIDQYDWTDGDAPVRHNKATMEYDDWGQVRRTSRTADGHTLSASLSVVDPIGLTRVEGIEGQGQMRSSCNLFGSITRVELLPKGWTKNDKPYSTLTYSHDGLGRIVKEKDHFGHAKMHQIDDFGRVFQTTAPDGSIVKTVYEDHTTDALPVAVQASSAVHATPQSHSMGQRSLDGLGRVVSQTVGGRTATKTYEGVAPNPNKIVSPTGDAKTAAYNVALENSLTQLQSSGETCAFGYDKETASLLHISNADASTDYGYRPSGLIKSESIKVGGLPQGLSTAASHSLAGKTLSYTNVHGQEQTRVFDGFGRLTVVSQGSLKATLEYDTNNRLTSNQVVDGVTKKSLVIRRDHDDFGRETKRTILHGTNVVRTISQSFNELGLVTRRLTKDGGNAVLRSDTFEYDACPATEGLPMHGLTASSGRQRTPDQGTEIRV